MSILESDVVKHHLELGYIQINLVYRHDGLVPF